jgi:hypothetical protein
MDVVQIFILTAEWVFFAAWGMIVATVSVIAFGRELLPSPQRATVENERR